MKKLSIIIPSLRTYRLKECLAFIHANTANVDYEVVVVGNAFPDHCPPVSLKFVYEEIPRGVVNAVNAGFAVSDGEYVCTLSDEALVRQNWASNMLRFLAGFDGDVQGCPKVVPPSPFHYFNKIFAPFPFMRRDLIEKVGGLFDQEYRSFYADPDLSMRVYANGGTVAVCEASVVYHPFINDALHQKSVQLYADQDRATFIKRWGHLGEFKDP